MRTRKEYTEPDLSAAEDQEDPHAPAVPEAEGAPPAGAGSAEETPAAGPEGAASGTEACADEQLARLQQEKDELFRAYARFQADFDNYRKRIERERGEDRARTTAAVVETLLPVVDGFERALAAHDDPGYEDYRKGFELIYKQLRDTLQRQGLVRIEAVGKAFDPHLHQAVERVADDSVPEGTVVEEVAGGYLLRDRLLRPAMVRVAYSAADTAKGVN